MNKENSQNSAKAVLRLPIEKDEDLARTNEIIPILNALDGILSVGVNHVTNTVSIEYDEQRITLAEIRSKIKQTIVPTSSEDRI
jgi:copper chaperone CopZ